MTQKDNENDKLIRQSILDTLPEHERVRVETVADELLKGLTPRAIAKKYTSIWHLAVSTIAHNYVQKARHLITEAVLRDPDQVKDDLIAKYQFLYQQNIESGDLREARQILDSVANLFFGNKLDITSGGLALTNIRLIEITDQQNIIDIEPDEV